MHRIKAVIVNTCREAIRNKLLYTVVFFLIILLGISSILGSFTMGEVSRFVINFGLAGIELLGVTMAIVTGTGIIYNEIQRKTIFTIIPKPIKRWEFILGKFLGLSIALLFQTILMLIVVILFLFIVGARVYPIILLGGLFIYLIIILTISITIFFSTFSSPILSGLFAATIYFIGNSLGELEVLISRISLSSGERLLIDFFYIILPNFSNLNIKNQVVHNTALPGGYALFSILYAVAYMLFMLLLATLIFEKKELY